jgi:hypothetical protein
MRHREHWHLEFCDKEELRTPDFAALCLIPTQSYLLFSLLSMASSRSFCWVLVLLSLLAGATASDVTTFTDAKCTRSWRALDATNGYPDGLCKPLNVTTGQSFQIQKLDHGCIGECTTRLYCMQADCTKLHCTDRIPDRYHAPVRQRLWASWRIVMVTSGCIILSTNA